MPKREDKQRRLEDRIGPIESVIAAKTKFRGKINSEDSIQISGNFRGDIKCEQLVKINNGGKIKGTISSTYVIIEGELTGDVETADYVEIRPEGRVVGNISTSEIAIAEGSFIQGEIKMPDKDEPVSFVEKRGNEEPEEAGEQESSEEEQSQE